METRDYDFSLNQVATPRAKLHQKGNKNYSLKHTAIEGWGLCMSPWECDFNYKVHRCGNWFS